VKQNKKEGEERLKKERDPNMLLVPVVWQRRKHNQPKLTSKLVVVPMYLAREGNKKLKGERQMGRE